MVKDLYYIMSINVVAYMRANGIEPVGNPERTDDGKIKYYFEDTNEFRMLLDKYGQDDFIQKFIGNLRLTKSEIRNITRA